MYFKATSAVYSKYTLDTLQSYFNSVLKSILQIYFKATSTVSIKYNVLQSYFSSVLKVYFRYTSKLLQQCTKKDASDIL